MAKRSIELIETLTLLIEIQFKSCCYGVFGIEPMVEQISEPFLKKSLMMFLYGYNSEGIRMTLTPEVGSTDVYRNLVIEGVIMLTNQFADNPTVMLKKFKSALPPEDQTKLDSMAGEMVEEWEEMCERGEVVF